MKTYAFKSIKVGYLALHLILMIFPLYWIISTSLKPQADIFQLPLVYWPKNLSFENYINIFAISKFHIYLGNSILISIISSIIVIIISILSAYVMSRFTFRGHKQIMMVFFITQMLPGFISLGPLYMLMSDMGLTNNRMSLVIMYTVMMIPFSTIMLRGFFQRIPGSLEEAAMIDGCSRLSAIWNVIIPVMLPGIASTFIFSFVQCWNELFMSVMLIDSEKLKTLPVAINGFVMKFNVDWGALSAGTVLSVLPTVIMFALAQRYIVEGLTAGAEKG